jgi:hypothetical protein
MEEILIGSTDRSIIVFIPDPASTTGQGKTGLAHSAVIVAYTRVETDNDVTVTDVTGSMNALTNLTDAHNDWGWKEVSSTLAPGQYRLDLADAVFATGAWTAVVQVTITSGLASAQPKAFKLVNFDLFGQSAIDLKDFADDGYDPSINLVRGDLYRVDGVALEPHQNGTLPADVTYFGGSFATCVGGRPEVIVARWIGGSTPNALVSGRVDASVGAMAANVITDTATAASFLTELRTYLHGFDVAAQMNSLGYHRVVDGTGPGELDLNAGVMQADLFMVNGDENKAFGLGLLGEEYFFSARLTANTVAIGGVDLDAFEGTGFRRFFGFDEPGHGPILWQGSIQSAVSQTVLELGTSASADNDAFNGCLVRIDNSTGTKFKLAVIEGYDGTMRRITLREDPGIFTVSTGDNVSIMADLSYWLTGPRLSTYGGAPTLFENQVSIASNIDTINGGVSLLQGTVDVMSGIVGRIDSAEILMNTTISTLTSQTVFRLAAGSPNNDAYNGCAIVIRNFSTNNQTCVGVVKDYVGATREVTLLWNPGIFTIASGHEVYVMSRRDKQGSDQWYYEILGNEASIGGMLAGIQDNVTATGSDILTRIGLPATGDLVGDLAGIADVVGNVFVNTDSIFGAIVALNDLSAAEVNAEMVDVLNVDTWAEPTGMPGSTASLVSKIGRLYKALMRGVDVTATEKQFKNAGGVTEWKKILADNGTTYSETSASTP